MYLGDGVKLAYGKVELNSATGNPAGGFVDFTRTIPTINTNGKITVNLTDGTQIKK
jgi:hypothetical protein